VIYVDSSVVLADLFDERRTVPDSFWREELVSSRLLEYEAWNRIHARELAQAKGERARVLISNINFIEMTPDVLSRALRPFAIVLRTLDSLHVATLAHLHASGPSTRLASYDKRMMAAAELLDIQLYRF
jgi:predicted nucleic acid-binding protein